MTCSRFVCRKCLFAGCMCVGWGVTLRFVQSVCGWNVGCVCVSGGVSLRLVLHHEQCNMIEECILHILNYLW